MNKKRVLTAVSCMIVGTIISGLSAKWSFMPELINFIGAVFLIGAFIYLDGAVMKHRTKEKTNSTGRYLALRLCYLVAGIVLLLVPVSLSMPEIPMRIAKGFGEAFLVTAIWEFFSYTTIAREES